MAAAPLKVYLVDDEPLALLRLTQLLEESGRVRVAGSTTDPEEALVWLSANQADAVFLDIQMPEINGFELVARLPQCPPIIFTTAYDRYALQAFEVNSLDYLLKPVEEAQLDRALAKLERYREAAPRPDLSELIRQLAAGLPLAQRNRPERIASRLGDRVQFVELSQVTHFFARDKLTFAATEAKDHVVDYTITELERQLDPQQFCRIHRSALLNLKFVQEIHTGFGGRMTVRLKSHRHPELSVARERVQQLRERLRF